MKTLIVSPHTDDAIFSLGDLIPTLGDVTILSVFAGIPTDDAGWKKHKTLRAEHTQAVKHIGAKEINLDFLDDVYEPRPSDKDLIFNLSAMIEGFDTIFIPLGTHHPDHKQIRRLFMRSSELRYDFIYRELPYGELYPDLVRELEERYKPLRKIANAQLSNLKMEAVMMYQSQIQNPKILKQLAVKEYIYQKL